MDGGIVKAWDSGRVRIIRDLFFDFLPEVVINSKDHGPIRLIEHIYRAQERFYEGVFDALADDIHNIFVLKSRQLGLSTSIRPLIAFWAGTFDGLIGTMVYDTAFNTSQARQEVASVIRNLPKRLHFPGIVVDNREGITLENGSRILFIAAGTKQGKRGGGLGRSLGINLAHVSEISSFVNEEGIVSFRQSLSDVNPDRLFVWESTARGYNNMWHKLWKEAIADDLGCKAMFFGWWAKNSQSIATDTPEFERYGSDPPTPREIARIAAVNDLYGWEVSRGQLAWYRRKTDPTRELDDDDTEDSVILQEQPWTEEEAFQLTGVDFFLSDRLNEIASELTTSPIRPQMFRFVPGLDFPGSEIVPARWKREIELTVWEEPAADSVYVVSGDPAYGHDEKNNNSAAQVLRCFADGIDQVAEYASASIQPHHFAWLLWTLVGYYGSLKPNCRVLMICELNGPGEEVWRQYNSIPQLVQSGYLRGRAKEKGLGDIFANARSYVFQRSDSMHPGHNYQWVTSVQRKVQIMEACRNFLHNRVFHPRSMDMIEEMRGITRDGDSIGAIEDRYGRDDRVFSAALGIRAWDEKLRRGLVAGNRTREAERARISMSIEDQAALWQRNTFSMFLKAKERDRADLLRQQMRASLRYAPRRPMPERRF